MVSVAPAENWKLAKIVFCFSSIIPSWNNSAVMDAPASVDWRLAINVSPQIPGIPRRGMSNGVSSFCAARRPSRCSTTFTTPRASITAGTNVSANSQASRAPLPPVPLKSEANVPASSVISPREPKEPEIFVKSSALMGPSAEEKIPEKKRKPLSVRAKRTIRRWIVVGVVTAAVAVSYLTITLQTYTGIEVVEQIQEARGGNSFYVRYGENILGCDADSVSLFNLEGKELWKESIQFQKPIMEVSRSSAAVAELRGNEIAVFGEDGLRGQIKTTLPIEKMAVSSQGITAVILENGGAPVIQCFDVSGNVLIEYKVSAATSGYPVDLALSPDGTKLLVSYMMTQNSEVDTQLAYYDFGNEHKDGDYRIGGGTYANQLMPTVIFQF